MTMTRQLLSRLAVLALLLVELNAFAPIQSGSNNNYLALQSAQLLQVQSAASRQQTHTTVPATSNNVIDNKQRTLPFLLSSTKLYSGSSSNGDSNTDGPVRIIIAGAPASGKGTQCERIKEHYNIVHLSTGDMLRAAVSQGTPVGKQAKEYMDSGRLVPDEVIIGVVKDRLAQDDCAKQGWLLDGFPRTETQAQALADAGIVADCFVFLNVPDSVLVERVIGRRTDPATGKIYHLVFSPPPEELLERLEHRSDDTEEKVKVRLEQFHANVEAVKGSYADISVIVDGNQAPAVVSDAIFEAITAKITREKEGEKVPETVVVMTGGSSEKQDAATA